MISIAASDRELESDSIMNLYSPVFSISMTGVSSNVLNAYISLLLLNISSVTFSPNRDPFGILNLNPKSSSSPPLLWQAVKFTPPIQLPGLRSFYLRIRSEIAGPDKWPYLPILISFTPLARASGMINDLIASELNNLPSPPM